MNANQKTCVLNRKHTFYKFGSKIISKFMNANQKHVLYELTLFSFQSSVLKHLKQQKVLKNSLGVKK